MKQTLIIPTEMLTDQIKADKVRIIEHCKKFGVDVQFGDKVKQSGAGSSILEAIFKSIFR